MQYHDNHRTGERHRLSFKQEGPKLPPGAEMNIVVNALVHLSELRSSDKDALIAHLNDPDIYERTLRIPFPYTDAAADEWLALVAKITRQQGRSCVIHMRRRRSAWTCKCRRSWPTWSVTSFNSSAPRSWTSARGRGQASHAISIRLSPLHIKVTGDSKTTLEQFWQDKKCLAVWVEGN
jgi:hypothetical protein